MTLENYRTLWSGGYPPPPYFEITARARPVYYLHNMELLLASAAVELVICTYIRDYME